VAPRPIDSALAARMMGWMMDDLRRLARGRDCGLRTCLLGDTGGGADRLLDALQACFPF
jgi:hypothetical protein